MRPVQPYRRRSSASFWMGALLVLLLGSGTVVALLIALGINLNPFAQSEDPFMVRIPINGQPIPAYQRVAREHLLNPATGGLMYQRVPPASAVGMSIVGISADGSHVEGRIESVRNADGNVVFVVAGGKEVSQSQTIELGGAMMNVNSIIGRVVKRDKRVGMGFQETTFFPQGTPEGIAGATPPGMRAITLDATKLTGVHSLNAGDRIDLMASVPMGEAAAFQSQPDSRLPGANLIVSPQASRNDGPTEPLLLAQGAVVLKPVYVRNEATTSASLTQGQRVQNVPKYEVAIAVASDDVIPLQSALDRELGITCIAHSMQPEGESVAAESVEPSTDERLVPVTVRAILAYDVVTREAFVSPATRQMRMEPISQQEIDRQGIVTSIDEALGAVARHDIPAGRFLRKSDLLSDALPARGSSSSQRRTNASDPQAEHDDLSPETEWSFVSQPQPQSPVSDEPLPSSVPSSSQQPVAAVQSQDELSAPTSIGDRPAISRFVPPGYTALAVPWNRLYGAEHLQIGDRLDLLASYSLERDFEVEETETRPDGTIIVRKRHDRAIRLTLRSWDESVGMRAEPWFIAIDAIVVGPVGFPAPAAALRALGPNAIRDASGNELVNFTGPSLIIAIENRDVESMAAALASKDVLFTPAMHPANDLAEAEEGWKRIAIAAQDLDPFVAISETVWQGNRRRLVSRRVLEDDPRFVNALSVAELEQYEGRVLARPKNRGAYFSADDFLPEGSEPGVAAAAVPGTTIFAVADDEIEGLDAFKAGDQIAILVRAVHAMPAGIIVHGFDFTTPFSRVIVRQATIVMQSGGGRTMLRINDSDLTRFQAARTASISTFSIGIPGSRESQLLAVALPRERANNASKPEIDAKKPAVSETEPSDDFEKGIPGFDPLCDVKLIQGIVGRQRETHAFAPGSRSQRGR